jgi:hypothetical protein
MPGKSFVVLHAITQAETAPSDRSRQLDWHVVVTLGDIDRYTSVTVRDVS